MWGRSWELWRGSSTFSSFFTMGGECVRWSVRRTKLRGELAGIELLLTASWGCDSSTPSDPSIATSASSSSTANSSGRPSPSAPFSATSRQLANASSQTLGIPSIPHAPRQPPPSSPPRLPPPRLDDLQLQNPLHSPLSPPRPSPQSPPSPLPSSPSDPLLSPDRPSCPPSRSSPLPTPYHLPNLLRRFCGTPYAPWGGRPQ